MCRAKNNTTELHRANTWVVYHLLIYFNCKLHSILYITSVTAIVICDMPHCSVCGFFYGCCTCLAWHFLLLLDNIAYNGMELLSLAGLYTPIIVVSETLWVNIWVTLFTLCFTFSGPFLPFHYLVFVPHGPDLTYIKLLIICAFDYA